MITAAAQPITWHNMRKRRCHMQGMHPDTHCHDKLSALFKTRCTLWHCDQKLGMHTCIPSFWSQCQHRGRRWMLLRDSEGQYLGELLVGCKSPLEDILNCLDIMIGNALYLLPNSTSVHQ